MKDAPDLELAVAIGVFAAFYGGGGLANSRWAGLPEASRELWHEFARAAISVVREYGSREKHRVDRHCDDEMPNQWYIEYRLVGKEWPLSDLPWSGAIGIQEVALYEDGNELFSSPPIVCWLARGVRPGLGQRIVDALNSDAEWRAIAAGNP